MNTMGLWCAQFVPTAPTNLSKDDYFTMKKISKINIIHITIGLSQKMCMKIKYCTHINNFSLI